LKLRYCWIFFR